MKSGFMSLALMWAISGTSLATPVDGEWTGTLSCGELQNSPNAKSKAPFTGAVTLTIHKNSASLDRVWPKGKEHLEGTVSRGQPIKLEGQGWFFGKEANAWKVRVKLFEIGQRYEGEGVLESVDGLTKYRDCKVRVESAIAPPQKSTTTNGKMAKEAPKNASKSEPANPVKPADPKLPQQSIAQAPNAKPVSPTESVADKRSSNSSPPNVTASEPTQATPLSQPVEIIVPIVVPTASAPAAVAAVASAPATGPMQSNATNSKPFSLGVNVVTLLGGVVVVVVGYLGYRRFKIGPLTDRNTNQVNDIPIFTEIPRPKVTGLSRIVKYGVCILILGVIGSYWIRITKQPTGGGENVTTKSTELLLQSNFKKNLYGGWRCQFDETSIRMELFTDDTSILDIKPDPDSEFLKYGSIRIQNSQLFIEQSASNFIKSPYSGVPTHVWEQATKGETISRSNFYTEEFLITESSKSSLTLKPIRLTNWDGNTTRDLKNTADGNEWNCKRDAEVNLLNEKNSIPKYLVKGDKSEVQSSVPTQPNATGEQSEGNDAKSVIGLASNKQPIYYNFKAPKGTDIRLSVESQGDAVVFHLYPPSAAALIARNIVPPIRITNEPMHQFNYRTTETGTYVVGVGFPKSELAESAKFKLKVTSEGDGLGDLIAGIGSYKEHSSTQPAQQLASKTAAECAQIQAMIDAPLNDSPRDAVKVAVERLTVVRDRAMQAIVTAENKGGNCPVMAPSIEKIILDADDRLAQYSRQVPSGQKKIPSILFSTCHTYWMAERQISACFH